MGSVMTKNNNTNQLSSNSRTMSSSSSSSAADPTARSSSSLCYRRPAHHAGSWYQKDASALDATLQEFLDNAATTATTNDHEDSSKDDSSSSLLLRAIICPHAGFSYSGPTAAYSYLALQQALVVSSNNNKTSNNKIKTILVLHPSHHVYINGCAVSGASVLETPLRDLPVNDTLRREILALNNDSDNADCVFSVMTQSQDEEEHSGEMQYPFLAKVIQNVAPAGAAARYQNMKKSTTTSTTTANGHSNHVNDTDTAIDEVITVLPIMCGSLSVQQEVGFGRLLSQIIHRPEILTVVSTDFCHWGSRFSYRPPCTTTTTTSGSSSQNKKNAGQEDVVLPIHRLIEQLDRRGMSLIEAQEPGAFAAYLKETKNTICGRHAVAVWLRALEAGTALTVNGIKNDNNDKEMLHAVRFICYAQSSPVTAMHESSVSYAAGIATTAATNDD